ncbi:SERTA domain-containing protein 3 [Marasmius crinis-equi]|uniref:SERTA domain-containing protein 3 n=1 Tax=Marasmius crinis-equi TaxID=585013 RepID=A0ABR3FII7_9AGAR
MFVLKDFREAFQRWWWNIAPDWRRTEGEDAELLRGDGDWTVLYDDSTGSNGMSSVIAALAWWQDKVQGLPSSTPRERQLWQRELDEWEETVKDVMWSYDQMLQL